MSKTTINLDLLADSLYELARMDAELRSEMLSDCGYNPEAVASRGVQFIKKLKFQTSVAAKKQKFQELYQSALASFKQLTGDSKQTLMSLLSNKGLSLQYRNLESFDAEDLQQVLDEATLLEIMEKIEKGELRP